MLNPNNSITKNQSVQSQSHSFAEVGTMDKVILVTDTDNPIGSEWKLEAHRKGLLHRAFSVFIFNSEGEMLLQQRALTKYHSPGLWTNTCCSHPRPGEETQEAAQRRLQEEMGFTTEISKIFDFVYKAEFDNGLTEFEFDHVFAGHYNGEIHVNSDEVESYCFKSVDDIKRLLQTNPDEYTVWFRIAFAKVEQWWIEHKKDSTV